MQTPENSHSATVKMVNSTRPALPNHIGVSNFIYAPDPLLLTDAQLDEIMPRERYREMLAPRPVHKVAS